MAIQYLKNHPKHKVYDPCMGTGGFLTRFYKLSKNTQPEDLYGCELNGETIKFAYSAMLITTGKTANNIKRCNSLSDNEFMFNRKKFDVIVTNPPFGTKLKYDDQKEKFEQSNTIQDDDNKAEENGKDEADDDDNNGNGKVKKVEFTEVYPVKTNIGTELFIQHCVFMLENGGLCEIVLPDGKLFEGKTSKNFRTWLINTVNIK